MNVIYLLKLFITALNQIIANDTLNAIKIKSIEN